MDYFEEAKRIWREHVPKSGQSKTVEGEMLRAVEKLRDEATRNGNGNWDEGFETLLAYLEPRLTDRAAFTTEQISEIRIALKRLRQFEQPYLDDDLYDRLGDRVVDYLRHHGSLPNTFNPDLRR
ncbi:MAG: hypothetical protein V4707_11285 [Pseudomonadota bacterium]